MLKGGKNSVQASFTKEKDNKIQILLSIKSSKKDLSLI